MTQHELIEESNRQFAGAWSRFAEPIPGAEIRDVDGLRIVNPNVPLFILNGAFLTSPLRDAADARRRAQAAVACFDDGAHGWVLPVCREWAANDPGEQFAAVLREAGLQTLMVLMGMSAEELAPARYPPPPELDIRLVTTVEQSAALAELNCVANHMPAAIGASIALPGYWSAPRFGYLGYVNGEPVAAGAVIEVQGVAYVGWMATAEDHRGKGYAEAIIRRALEAERRRTGITRTILHATAMGEPVYRRLGYRTHTVFTCWARMK